MRPDVRMSCLMSNPQHASAGGVNGSMRWHVGCSHRPLTRSAPACPAVDQPLVTPALLRNIVGQAVFQLGVMYTLVSRGDAIFRVPR